MGADQRIKELENQRDLLWQECVGLRERIDRTWNAFVTAYGLGSGSGSGTWGYNPDTSPASPSAYDDEFGVTTLNAKWTPVNCVTGTVNLFAVDLANGVYDLTMFPGNVALQPTRDSGSNDKETFAAMIEQTVDLATNCKLVAKVAVGGVANADAIIECGIMISGADGFDDDNYIAISIIQNFGGGQFTGVVAVGSVGGTPFYEIFVLECPYLMIVKTGTNFTVFVSTNGKAWINPLDAVYELGLTMGVKLRAFAYLGHDSGTLAPIGVLDFVRYFANNTPKTN